MTRTKARSRTVSVSRGPTRSEPQLHGRRGRTKRSLKQLGVLGDEVLVTRLIPGGLAVTGEEPLLQLRVLGLCLVPYPARFHPPDYEHGATSKAPPAAARHCPNLIDRIQP